MLRSEAKVAVVEGLQLAWDRRCGADAGELNRGGTMALRWENGSRDSSVALNGNHFEGEEM